MIAVRDRRKRTKQILGFRKFEKKAMSSQAEGLLKLYYGHGVYKGFSAKRDTTAGELIRSFLDRVSENNQRSFSQFEIRIYRKGESKPIENCDYPLRIQQKKGK